MVKSVMPSCGKRIHVEKQEALPIRDCSNLADAPKESVRTSRISRVVLNTERGWGLQQAEAIQEDELAKLPPGVFDNGIALRHPENAALSLKYLWDFFPASYNCPLREKVWVPAARQIIRHDALECLHPTLHVEPWHANEQCHGGCSNALNPSSEMHR